MLRRTTTAAACTLTLVTVAAPATALTEPVDLTVHIGSEHLPKRFLAEDVVVGPGPELTADDLIELSPQCGAVEVDIDPDARTITTTSTDTGCTAQSVLIHVISEEVAQLHVQVGMNELATWSPGIDGLFEVVTGPIEFRPPGMAALWIVPQGEILTLSGQSVFSYAPVATPPVPVATPQPSPVTSPAPVPVATPAPAAAAAARPVVAQPTFTG